MLVFFSLSVTPKINDEVFEHVTAIKHVQYTLFFQLKWASVLKMVRSPRPFLEQKKKKKIFAVRPYHSKSLSAEICLDQQNTAVVQEVKVVVFLFQGE